MASSIPHSFLCVCSTQCIGQVSKRKLQLQSDASVQRSPTSFQVQSSLRPLAMELRGFERGVRTLLRGDIERRRAQQPCHSAGGGGRAGPGRAGGARERAPWRGGALGAQAEQAGRRARKHRSRRRGAGAAAACRAAGLPVGSRARTGPPRPLACSALRAAAPRPRAASASGAVHQAGGAVRGTRCAVPRSRYAVRAAVRRGARTSPRRLGAFTRSVRSVS